VRPRRLTAILFSRPAIGLSVFLWLCGHLGAVPLGAVPLQDLAEWFRTEKRAARYTEVRSDLERVVQEAQDEGLPAAILVERVREGAAKAVRPEALRDAVSEELERLRQVSRVLQEAGIAESARVPEVYRTLLLCLRAGLHPETLREVLLADAGPPDPPDRAVASCETLLKLTSTTALEESERRRLGVSLVSSRLPTRGYTSIPSVFARGRSGGLTDREIADIIVLVLDGGGGIIQISEELERRVR
jgi:hypothetical protein